MLAKSMECPNNGGAANKITKEDVIEKIKDDGDFDRLRLKIIRKLKENEKLRSSISLVVKQSSALNRAGAENMKPRQLSNAILEEVGNQVMSQLSDGLWGIIRSEDGMKDEIRETVQTVYNNLSKPGEVMARSSTSNMLHAEKKIKYSSSTSISADKQNGAVSDNDQFDPRGFNLLKNHHVNDRDKQHIEVSRSLTRYDKGKMEAQKEQQCDGSDEDPDVPPGFG